MECVHASSATTGFDAEIKSTDKIGLCEVVPGNSQCLRLWPLLADTLKGQYVRILMSNIKQLTKRYQQNVKK